MRMDDGIQLRHMLDAARESIAFARGRTRMDLDADRMLVLALVKAIEIIGEAAHRISPVTRGDFPMIPWDIIVGMRHRLVHGYFDINLDILWKTVQEDMPMLVALLRKMLGEDEK